MRRCAIRTAKNRRGLSAKQIAAGMNAAARNAKRLLDDATLLFDAKRFPTACSLAILSIEESGKISILRGMAGVSDQITLKTNWRDYTDHRIKNAMWIITELATKGARTLDDLTPIFDEDSDHRAVLDVIKQLGFYTDCYRRAHWSEPDNVITEALAKMLLFVAKILLPKHEVAIREIELWIEHVVEGTPDFRQASISFFAAMEREGLSSFTMQEIEEFYGISKPKPH